MVRSGQQAAKECLKKHPKSFPPLPLTYEDAEKMFETVKGKLQPYDQRFVLGYIKNPFALEDEWQAINEETNVMNLEIFNEGEPNNNEGKHFCVGVDEKKHYSYDCHEMHSLVCEVFISTQTLGF
ncbi:uncharacterized protein LOC142354458 [Convolutriloba macropyga]|uniref:uncharacterized protein LOC142354458 n=1 Tax=Convolutriloba macropyga TaxID=536237 RepID=UPI003F51D658